jgi:hypothetical protein
MTMTLHSFAIEVAGWRPSTSRKGQTGAMP